MKLILKVETEQGEELCTVSVPMHMAGRLLAFLGQQLDPSLAQYIELAHRPYPGKSQ